MVNLTKLKIWGPEAESENEQKSETVNLNRIKTQDSFESKLSKLHGNSDSDSDDNADGEAEGNADKGMTKSTYGGSEEEQQQKKNKDKEKTHDYNKYNTKDNSLTDLNLLNPLNKEESNNDSETKGKDYKEELYEDRQM